jgi:hypothetical protein
MAAGPSGVGRGALINTGFQAGDHARRKPQAVLTAFIILPVQPVAIYKLSQFLRNRAHAMMFFLICDVSGDLIHI